MNQLNFYTSEKISEHVIKITSMTGEFQYLIIGKERAALIDTCLGIGNLRSFVEKLTDKPITVILSHGHVDHAMGAPEFDEVYMNPADRSIYQKHKALDVRKGYINMSLAGRMPLIEETDYVQPAPLEFKELKDRMVFDLGNITLEVFEAPGHTPGSMAFLIKEDRALFLGDACNTFTFLFDEDSLSVEEYCNVLRRLDRLTCDQYDKVYLSHGMGTAPKEMITTVIEVCQDIMSDKADDIPFEFMGHQAYIAKAINQHKRVDGGLGNVIYNKKNVFINKVW